MQQQMNLSLFQIHNHLLGLANLAFFLANAMAESIQFDACDELHWEKSGSRYSLANPCGQNGRDYSSEIWYVVLAFHGVQSYILVMCISYLPPSIHCFVLLALLGKNL